MKNRMILFSFLILFSSSAYTHAVKQQAQTSLFSIVHLQKQISSFFHVPYVSFALPNPTTLLHAHADKPVILASERKPSLARKLFERATKNIRKKITASIENGYDSIAYFKSKKARRRIKSAVRKTISYACTYGIPLGMFATGVKYLGDRQQRILDQQTALQKSIAQLQTTFATQSTTPPSSAPAPDLRIAHLDSRTHHIEQLAELIAVMVGVEEVDVSSAHDAARYVERCLSKDEPTHGRKRHLLFNKESGNTYSVIPIKLEKSWMGNDSYQEMWEEKEPAYRERAHALHGKTEIVFVPYYIENNEIGFIYY